MLDNVCCRYRQDSEKVIDAFSGWGIIIEIVGKILCR